VVVLTLTQRRSVSIQATTEKAVVIEQVLSKGVSMCKFDVEDETIYCAASLKEELLYENNMPMYSQILDAAAVLLAEGIKHLESRGAIVRSYNTDSITFKAETLLPMTLSTDKLGGWKSEEPKPFEYQVKPMLRLTTFSTPPIAFTDDVREDDFGLVGEYVEGGPSMSCYSCRVSLSK
jgi:hypothetical protein